jgi:membrane protease YdiL (CAAX protease family)
MGANNKGNSPNSNLSIFTTIFLVSLKLQNYNKQISMPLKNSWVEFSPLSKLILIGVLMTFCSLVSIGLFLTLNEFTWGFSFTELSFLNMDSDPQLVWAAKFLQMFSQMGLFILPALGFAYFISKKPFKELDLTRAPHFRTLVMVLIITLLSIPFINYLAFWNAELHLPSFLGFAEDWMRSMQSKNDLLMEVVLQMNSSRDIIINIVMMTLLPAIGEELLFRGVIQKQLIKSFRNPHVAIFVTSFVFSAFHLQFLGFFSRLLLGMVFGYVYYYSKNIWTAIWAHFINNGLALSMAIIYGTQAESMPLDSAPSKSQFLIGTVCFIGALAILINQRNSLLTKP